VREDRWPHTERDVLVLHCRSAREMRPETLWPAAIFVLSMPSAALALLLLAGCCVAAPLLNHRGIILAIHGVMEHLDLDELPVSLLPLCPWSSVRLSEIREARARQLRPVLRTQLL
jgi:hypothetical protein